MDTEKVFHLGYQVIAIDLSQRFVRRTQTRVPGAIVRKMDMRFLDFPTATFDGLWASFSLLHKQGDMGRPDLS
jgi:methyltransferase family protein